MLSSGGYGRQRVKLGNTPRQTLLDSEGPAVSREAFEYALPLVTVLPVPDISTAREVEAGELQVY